MYANSNYKNICFFFRWLRGFRYKELLPTQWNKSSIHIPRTPTYRGGVSWVCLHFSDVSFGWIHRQDRNGRPDNTAGWPCRRGSGQLEGCKHKHLCSTHFEGEWCDWLISSVKKMDIFIGIIKRNVIPPSKMCEPEFSPEKFLMIKV